MTVHATSFRQPAKVGRASEVITNRKVGLYRDFFKRTIDVFCVVASLPIILPFIAVMSALIARDGHSPFFRQERVGKDGRKFAMWKFRTMVPNAEGMLDRYLEENTDARKEWDAKQKLADDERVAAIGKLLRRSSLDEIPQLWNVLKGDMSLIGPRPMMLCQQALYPGKAYYELRPGMTGQPWPSLPAHAM